MANRATKSGLAAEAHNKMLKKYSEERATEILQWIATLLNNHDISTDGSMENFYETLKDGVILCKVVNELQPGIVRKVETSKMAFKCMENINNFTKAAEQLGVPSQETFQSVDLWEKQNLNAVTICLESLGRKAGKYGKAQMGPKEAARNERQFSDETLQAGKTVISLQYGSNKGATQSGQNFGNTRHM